MSEITFEVRDDFQRRPIAEKVISLLDSEVQVSPMVIDGNWGTGKSEFCRKLIHLIEDSHKNLQPVYIDAFKADHADEPIMTLLSGILGTMPEPDRPSVIQAALPVMKFSLKTALKAGVSWVLKQEADEVAAEFTDDLKNAGDQAINYTVESLLTEHIEVKAKIEVLRKALTEVAKDRNIIVFIDELDRCRPDFAVSMLESIKHIFDAKGVKFVLVTNSNQLRASINHCYGHAIDAQRYLDKFIGFSFRLPDNFGSHYSKTLASVHHMKTLVSNSETLGSHLLFEAHIEFFSLLIKENNLSLREVETFVKHLEIYQLLAGDGLSERKPYGYVQLSILGVFIFCFKPKLSDELMREIVDVKAIAQILGKEKLIEILRKERAFPDDSDIIVAIAGAEATKNSKGFTVSTDEEYETWHQHFREFFERISIPDQGTRLNAVRLAIQTLQLGS